MPEPVTTFADILAPLATQTFLTDYFDKAPLHIPGTPDKFQSVLTWDGFVELLNISGIWSQASLRLKLDRQDIPPPAYCQRVVDRNQIQVWQPQPAKVSEFIRRGASLVCNEIETLTPGLRRAVAAIETAFGGRANCNLYCSRGGRQAFDSHYDKHEALVLHIAGEKRWRIYQARIENPIHHALFANQTQAFLDAKKGPVMTEVTTRAGDFLYLPRGQFHDALAGSDASVHITFALALPNGLALLTDAWEQAAADPLFRANLPLAAHDPGDARFAAHVEALGHRFAEIVSGPEFVERAKRIRHAYPVTRSGYDLPPPADETGTADPVDDVGPAAKGAANRSSETRPRAKPSALFRKVGKQ